MITREATCQQLCTVMNKTHKYTLKTQEYKNKRERAAFKASQSRTHPVLLLLWRIRTRRHLSQGHSQERVEQGYSEVRVHHP